MVMIPAGLGSKNDSAGEDQQQFTPPNYSETEKYGHESRWTRNQGLLCWRGPATIYQTDNRREGPISKHVKDSEITKCDHGFRQDTKPRLIVLARASSNLPDRQAVGGRSRRLAV
jgi:hypothetical protein